MLSVDATGEGYSNHDVMAVGYDDTTHEYACYDAQGDTSLHWYSIHGTIR